jgi:hypothetical protein
MSHKATTRVAQGLAWCAPSVRSNFRIRDTGCHSILMTKSSDLGRFHLFLGLLLPRHLCFKLHSSRLRRMCPRCSCRTSLSAWEGRAALSSVGQSWSGRLPIGTRRSRSLPLAPTQLPWRTPRRVHFVLGPARRSFHVIGVCLFFAWLAVGGERLRRVS